MREPPATRGRHFGAGLRAFHGRRVPAARGAFVRSIVSGEREAAWAATQLVQTFVQRGQIEAAPAFIGAELAGSPALARLALACVLARRGHRGQALRELARAARQPESEWAARLERLRLTSNADGDAELAACERHFARSGDAWGLAAILMQRAFRAASRGSARQALSLLEQAAGQRRLLGDCLGEAYAYQRQAELLYRSGDYLRALARLELALDRHTQCGHELGRAVILNNMGLWHLDLASPRWAAEVLVESSRAFRRLGDAPRRAMATANLGTALRRLGHRRASLAAHRSAIGSLSRAARTDAHAIAVAELAEGHTRGGQPQRALSELTRLAGPRLRRIGWPVRAQLELERMRALVAAQRRVRPSDVRRARQLLDHLAGHGDFLAVLRARTALGMALVASGRGTQAGDHLRRSLAQAEEHLDSQPSLGVRLGLASLYRDLHETLCASLLARGDGARAWEAVARFSARELRRAPRGGSPPRAAAQAVRLIEAGDAGPAGNRELEVLRLAYLDAHRQAKGARAASPASARALAGRLDEASALVHYHVACATSWAFLVHHGAVRALELEVAESRLEAGVRQLIDPMRAAAAPELASFDLGAAARLRRILIEPVLRELPREVKRLVVVADGPLFELPLELLPERVDRDRSHGRSLPGRFDAATYLVEQLSISYALAPQLIARRGGGAPRPGIVVGLGHSPSSPLELDLPSSRARLAPLPGVAAELATLARIFRDVNMITNSAATPASYRELAPRARILHLAAHAIADPDSPGLCGLALAPERKGARLGFLCGEVIRRIALPGSLVVLSACETNWGHRTREGFLGLARMFLEAGARAVVASLWPVDDEASRWLMARFYHRLAAGESASDALALAKRELRQHCSHHLYPRHAHPFFWAPYVLIDHGFQAAGRRA